MLARFLTRPSHLRLLTLISSQNHFSNPKPHYFHTSLPLIPNPTPNFPSVVSRFFSSNQDDNGGNKDQRSSTDDFWKLSTEEDSVFGEDAGTLEGISGGDAKPEEESWLSASAEGADTVDDIFKGVKKSEIGGGGDDWATADGYKPWTLVEEEKGDQVFDFGEEVSEMRSDVDERVEIEKSEEDRKLEEEEKVLSAVLQGKFQFFIFLLQPLICTPLGT